MEDRVKNKYLSFDDLKLQERLSRAKARILESSLPKSDKEQFLEMCDEIERLIFQMAAGIHHAIDMLGIKEIQRYNYLIQANMSWLGELSYLVKDAADAVAEREIKKRKALNDYDISLLDRVFVTSSGSIVENIRVKYSVEEVKGVPITALISLTEKGALRKGDFSGYSELQLLKTGKEALRARGSRIVRISKHLLGKLFRNIKAIITGAVLAVIAQNAEKLILHIVSLM